MNRLALLKRALGLAATPALVMAPPEWRALTPSEPSIPEPPLPQAGWTTAMYGGAAFAMPMHSHAHNAGMSHTHGHTHVLGCPMCLKLGAHTH